MNIWPGRIEDKLPRRLLLTAPEEEAAAAVARLKARDRVARARLDGGEHARWPQRAARIWESAGARARWRNSRAGRARSRIRLSDDRRPDIHGRSASRSGPAFVHHVAIELDEFVFPRGDRKQPGEAPSRTPGSIRSIGASRARSRRPASKRLRSACRPRGRVRPTRRRTPPDHIPACPSSDRGDPLVGALQLIQYLGERGDLHRDGIDDRVHAIERMRFVARRLAE